MFSLRGGHFVCHLSKSWLVERDVRHALDYMMMTTRVRVFFSREELLNYVTAVPSATSAVLADANWDSKEDPQLLCGSPSDDICPDQDNLGPQGAPE